MFLAKYLNTEVTNLCLIQKLGRCGRLLVMKILRHYFQSTIWNLVEENSTPQKILHLIRKQKNNMADFINTYFNTMLFIGIIIMIVVTLIRRYMLQRAAYLELKKLFQQRKAEGERFNAIPCSVKKFRGIACSKIKAD